MAITSEVIRDDYVGNGVLDTYPFTFIIYDQGEISVYVDGVLKTVDVHYTIASTDIEVDAGGDIVFGVLYIPDNLSEIAIISNKPYTQETSLALRNETYEETYDKAVILIKQLKEMIGRGLILDIDSLYSDLTLPDPVAGYYLSWKADLSGLENNGVSPIQATVEKTISGGSITVTSGQRHIQLIGEGDLADILTGITGGEEMDLITLWRKASVGYDIIINTGGGLYLQSARSFTINSTYDNITLVCRASGVWVEYGGRASVG